MSRVEREKQKEIYFCCSQMHQRPPRLVREPWSPTSSPSFPSPLLRISLRTFLTWARHTRTLFFFAIWLLLLFLFFSFFLSSRFRIFQSTQTNTFDTWRKTFPSSSHDFRAKLRLTKRHCTPFHDDFPPIECTLDGSARVNRAKTRKLCNLGDFFFPQHTQSLLFFFFSIFSEPRSA
jgi:hypothetical protein